MGDSEDPQAAGRPSEIEDTQILEPVPQGGSGGRAFPLRVVAWSAGALVAGLLLGYGITSAVTSGDDNVAAAATPTPAASEPVATTATPEETPTEATGEPSSTADESDEALEGAACVAVITAEEQWSNGFKYDIDVTAGESALTGWTVTVVIGPDATVDSPWRASLSSSEGGVATFVNEDFNGDVDAGETVDFGFNGSGSPSDDVTLTCAAG